MPILVNFKDLHIFYINLYLVPLGPLLIEFLLAFSSLIAAFLPFPDNLALFWFSRHISLWGSISFNLAVFINLAVALFYPFGDDGDEGKYSLVLFFVLILDAFISKVTNKAAFSGAVISGSHLVSPK